MSSSVLLEDYEYDGHYGHADHSINNNAKAYNSLRTRARALFIPGVAFVLGALLSLILAYLFLSRSSSPTPEPSSPDYSPLPPSFARSLDANIDPSAEPCDDFYQFSCGGFEAAHPVDAFSDYSIMFNVANEQLTTQIVRLLNDKFTAQFQVIDDCAASLKRPATNFSLFVHWLNEADAMFANSNSLDEFYYSLGRFHALALLSSWNWNVDVKADQKRMGSSEARPLQFEGFLQYDSPLTNYYSPFSVDIGKPWFEASAFLSALPALQAAIEAQFPGSGSHYFFDPANHTAKDVLDAVDYTRSVFEPTGSDVSLVSLSAVASVFPYRSYYRGLGNHSFIPSFYGLDGSAAIDLRFTGLAEHLTDAAFVSSSFNRSIAAIADAFKQCKQGDCTLWQRLRWSAKAHLYFEFLPTFTAADISRFGWSSKFPPDISTILIADTHVPRYCLIWFGVDYYHLFFHKWFQHSFRPNLRSQLTELAELIYDEFGAIIQSIDWLDASTRIQAISKFTNIVTNVVYDSFWNYDQYGSFLLGRNDYVGDFLAGHSYRIQHLLMTTGVINDPRNLVALFGPMVSMMDTNAFYFQSTNSINMIPGLTVNPIFNPDLPTLLNIASYGWVFGHEYFHSIDASGSRFNAIGELANWWSDYSRQRFVDKQQCIIDQYAGFTVFGEPVNANATLNENIADIGGLRAAMRAAFKHLDRLAATGAPVPQYHARYSNRQLFFIHAAQTWCDSVGRDAALANLKYDVHAPAPYRVEGPISNMPEFAEAFSCSSDSKYGRSLTKQRCDIWG